MVSPSVRSSRGKGSILDGTGGLAALVAVTIQAMEDGGVGGVGSEDLLLLALEERCLGDAGAIAQYCRGVAEFGLLLAVLQTKFSLLH